MSELDDKLKMIDTKISEEINSKFVELGLEKGYFTLYNINIDFLGEEIEIGGLDKKKGEEFTIFYDCKFKSGRIHYYNGIIKRFNC